MKVFSEQFEECRADGLNNDTLPIEGKEFIEKYPELLPRSPKKYGKITKDLINGDNWRFIKCGKFGGICYSGNKGCQIIRDIELRTGEDIIDKIRKEYNL